MRAIAWMVAGVAAFVIGGCAGMQGSPDAATRQAVAPTGKLRVAFLSGARIYSTKDAATGELKGVAPDLGKALAQRLGVPYEAVAYASVPSILAGAKANEFDVVLMGINPERAAAIDFSAPYMEVEQGYLVRAGVPVAADSEVDKAGLRVGVVEKAGADGVLSRTLRNATLVRVATVNDLFAAVGAGKVDVVAGTKTALFVEAQSLPGSRVLDGRFLVEPIGMGVPKGRSPGAAAFVDTFVAEAKADGRVKAAIDRAGLRGVVVAPPK